MAILRSFGLQRATKRRRPPALKDADVMPAASAFWKKVACTGTTHTLGVSWFKEGDSAQNAS
jgi:hypothetical protein